jgi:hypothetical protein
MATAYKAPTPKTLKRERDKALQVNTQFRSVYRDVYRLMMPMRDTMDKPVAGQERGFEVFDGTAQRAAPRFANRIQSSLFPPFQDFVKLEAGPEIAADQRDIANKILDDATKKFHALINRSNFPTAINEFLLDLGVGTGTMMFLEGPDWDPFNFVTVPQFTVMMTEGPWGTVGKVFRNWCMPVALVPVQWPDIEMPKDWSDKLTSDPDAEVSFFEAMCPDYEASEWRYYLIDEKGDKQLLKAPRVYKESSPWIITRWIKAANEVQGRGPMLDALADARTANKVVELTLKNASLAITGVYTGVDDGVLNPSTAAMVPGAVIPVARNQGHPMGASLMPLERSGDFDVSHLLLADLRMAIKEALYDKVLPPMNSPIHSPTEIIERVKELNIDIGAAFGRIMNELVKPIVLRGLQIMQRKGLITYPFTIDGKSVKVTVVSPLAQQQSLDDVQSVVQWLTLLAQFSPDLLPIAVKMEDLPRWLGTKLKVDTDLMRDQEGTAMVVNMLNSIVQRQQQAQQQSAAGAMPIVPSQGAPA